MSKEQKPLSDVWLELQLVTMGTDLSEGDRKRLEGALEALKAHVHSNQEKQRRIILQWFLARIGPRLFSNHSNQLLVELANLMSTIWTGMPQFKNPQEVQAWLQKDAAPPLEDDEVDDSLQDVLDRRAL